MSRIGSGLEVVEVDGIHIRLVLEDADVPEAARVVGRPRVLVVDQDEMKAVSGVKCPNRNAIGDEAPERWVVSLVERDSGGPVLRAKQLKDARLVYEDVVFVQSNAVDLSLGSALELELENREGRDGQQEALTKSGPCLMFRKTARPSCSGIPRDS